MLIESNLVKEKKATKKQDNQDQWNKTHNDDPYGGPAKLTIMTRCQMSEMRNQF